MIQPVSSIRISRALKLLLGASFQEAVPYEVRVEGVGEDTFIRVYKPLAAAVVDRIDEPPFDQPYVSKDGDCNARLSPDGTHYIHAHDCARAIELNLPRDPAPAERVIREPDADPIPAEPEIKGGRVAMRAAILCDEGGFRVFLGADDKNHAAEIIRTRCGITSRRELDHNPKAASTFLALTRDYDAWLRDAL